MRIMAMHKVDADTEAGRMPSPEKMAAIGGLMEEMGKTGIMRGGEGLMPSSQRARLTRQDGRDTVTKGPLTGSNELPAALLQVKVKTLDDAIALAKRFADAVGDGEIEVGPVTEFWDLGVMPKPDDAPLRVLLIQKASPAFESGARDAAADQRVESLLGELRASGAFLEYTRLTPSAQAKRLTGPQGRRKFIDGPFAESKELISGYVLLEVAAIAEALPWLERFALVVGDLEMDVRPIAA